MLTNLYNPKTKKVPCVLLSAGYNLDREVCNIFSGQWELSLDALEDGFVKLTGTAQQWRDLRDGKIQVTPK